jgi:hypothetical protein
VSDGNNSPLASSVMRVADARAWIEAVANSASSSTTERTIVRRMQLLLAAGEIDWSDIARAHAVWTWRRETTPLPPEVGASRVAVIEALVDVALGSMTAEDAFETIADLRRVEDVFQDLPCSGCGAGMLEACAPGCAALTQAVRP